MLLARTNERGLRMSAITIRKIEGVQLFDGCRRSQLKAIDRLGMTLDLSADFDRDGSLVGVEVLGSSNLHPALLAEADE